MPFALDLDSFALDIRGVSSHLEQLLLNIVEMGLLLAGCGCDRGQVERIVDKEDG